MYGSRIKFIWDGSRLLQEIHPHGNYTYVYIDRNYGLIYQIWLNFIYQQKSKIYCVKMAGIQIERLILVILSIF